MMLMRSSMALVAVVLATAACAPDGDVGDVDGASITIPLVQTGPDGAVYRLGSASFEVTGPDGAVQTVDGNVDAASIVLSLAPGPYSVRLLPGWALERSLDGTAFEPVMSLIGSQNPQAVRVFPDTAHTVQFRFFLRDAGGALTVTFGVVPDPQQLYGTLSFATATGVLAQYAGLSVSFALYFDGASQSVAVDGGDKVRRYTPVGIGAEFFDDPIGIFRTVVAAQTTGGSLDIVVRAHADGTRTVAGTSLSATGSPLTFGPGPVQVALDAGGFPVDAAFTTTTSYSLTGPMSTASGTIVLSHAID